MNFLVIKTKKLVAIGISSAPISSIVLSTIDYFFFLIGFYKNAWLTFPDTVNPVNMKFMSSPLLHLSELPSIFNSTLLGSNKQKI